MMLRNVATKLKTIDSLKEFINPPNLIDLPNYKTRLELIESRGHIMSEQALEVARNVQELSQDYNTSMNMLVCWLKEGDDLVTEARIEGNRKKKKERRGVAFQEG
eukprot:Platyproteum_vivax@DN13535_c0_g1_i1.p1